MSCGMIITLPLASGLCDGWVTSGSVAGASPAHEQVDDVVALLHSRQLLFVHPPRTGGTSVEAHLATWGTFGDFVVGGVIGDLDAEAVEAPGGAGLHKHMTAQELLGCVADFDTRDYVMVATCRDPLALMFSAWNYCLAQLAKSRLLSVHGITEVPAPRLWDEWPLSFGPMRPALASMRAGKGFVGFLAAVLDDEELINQLSQKRFSDCPAWHGRTRLLRRDKLSEDWEALCRELELPGGDLPFLAASMEVSVPAFDSIPNDVHRRVRRAFAADFAYLRAWL